GNPVLAGFIDVLAGQTARSRLWRARVDAGVAERSVAEHAAVLAAIRDGDPERARLRVWVHLLVQEESLGREPAESRPFLVNDCTFIGVVVLAWSRGGVVDVDCVARTIRPGGSLAAPVLHSDILNTRGAEIAGGTLQDGDGLTLAGLEERFGVSRTVVREAMRILESLGMVSAKRRVGLTVQPVASWSVLDPQVIAWRLSGAGRAEQLRSLTQLRVALEPSAARLAAQTAPHTGPELITLAARMRELGEQGRGDTPEYLEIDVQFHTLLLTSGGNEMFAALGGSVAEVLTGRTRLGLTPAHPAHAAVENHEELARAISAGDAVRAERHTRA